MASVMNTHRFEGIRYEFVPGREVIPISLRMNHGGSSVRAEGPVHSHTHETYAATDYRDRTRTRTSAQACPLALGNACTYIAGNGRLPAHDHRG